MGRKFHKCLKIAKEIGDRRVDKVLQAIFLREKKAYIGDLRAYDEIIEEINARAEERHGIIAELKTFVGGPFLDECVADLKDAEEEDFAELGRLMQLRHAAAVKVGEKSRIIKKIRKFN